MERFKGVLICSDAQCKPHRTFFNDYKLSYLLVKKLVGSYFNKSLDEFQCQAMGIASYSLYRLGENVLAYVFANQIKDVDKEVLPMLDFLNYKSGGEIEKILEI